MADEPFFAKYVRAEQKRDGRDQAEAHISELTFAIEAATWFTGGANDCA